MKRILVMVSLLCLAAQYPFMGERANSKWYSELESGFRTPPDSVKPRVYWYWLSNNISEEGVTRDLEAMSKVGIGGAYVGNVGLDSNETIYGNVKFFSPEWWKITERAVSTATRLGMDIGFFNSPGWSQSGGPWVKPDESMRHLALAEFHVSGPQEFHGVLSVLYKDFQDVAVIAFQAPKDDEDKISEYKPEITSNVSVKNLENMFDGNMNSETFFPFHSDSLIEINITVKDPFTARSITFFPVDKPFKADCELQSYKDGEYQTIRRFEIDRSNPSLQVGFMPYGPICISFPEVSSSRFRVVLDSIDAQEGFGFKEIDLSGAARVDRYVEKRLGKMHETFQPVWSSYHWQEQSEVKDKDLNVSSSNVLDISRDLSSGGILKWKVPKGEWIVLRCGMVPTGVHNEPAAPEAEGLEIDKMSKQDIRDHFNAFVGKILKRIPAKERKSLRFVVADSYETGPEDWTDGFQGIFRKAYGYDPLPWLPVLTGRIVGAADQSNRFLWDLRRLVADLIAYNYVGGLREVSHQHGLKLWLENYGAWGFPSEFLLYGGQTDEVSGEFWAEGDIGKIELKDASSAAHIYGKNRVWAESFTAGGGEFWRYPAYLKRRCDWAFTEGVNSTVLHVYIEQPYEDRRPGVNAWFGTEFNRLNTWFYESKSFIDYIRRCDFMLQQGKPVEDVAYFIGEDAPLMGGIREPELPAGYSYDYINADVIDKDLKVRDGRLVLPDGVSYCMMVLPPLKTIRPELLRKIRSLVEEGAVILGPSPTSSPSLQDYPKADKEVEQMALELWGDTDGKEAVYRKFGKGIVMMGMDMKAALDKIDVSPDFQLAGGDSVLFIHRSLPNADIYFLTNQSYKTISVEPSFRVTGERPELWNPITGETRTLPVFTENNKSISVPLTISPSQSWFVVFKKSEGETSSANGSDNFPAEKVMLNLTGPWQVSFDSTMRGPKTPVLFDTLEDWTKRPEENIRYYSGTAVYKTSFDISAIPAGQKIYLDLGNVFDIAHVRVNGQDVGEVWTAPWQVDATQAIKSGNNELEVDVVNTWVNRLIGDINFPAAERKTWTIVNPYKSDSPLEPSGLVGPVKLMCTAKTK